MSKPGNIFPWPCFPKVNKIREFPSHVFQKLTDEENIVRHFFGVGKPIELLLLLLEC